MNVNHTPGATSAEPYILVRGLAKSYGPRADSVVFHNLSLVVYHHEFLTIFGRNGCGKSTLLRLIAGIDSGFAAGKITIGGKRPSETRVGFVFQDVQNSLFPWKNSIDNIAFPLELRGVPRRERRQRARMFLEQYHIEIPENSYPHELSGGQRQQIAIVRALLAEPELLLLDEPFANIDFETRLSLQGNLTRLWSTGGVTVLFVSHDVDEAAFLGDRIVVLSGRPADVCAIVDNPLPRPRTFEDLQGSVHLDVRARILDAFGREAAK